MNIRAIIHESGWVAVTSNFGPSSFSRSHGVMQLTRFLVALEETPNLNRVEVRPPRHEAEWQWEVEHSIGLIN